MEDIANELITIASNIIGIVRKIEKEKLERKTNFKVINFPAVMQSIEDLQLNKTSNSKSPPQEIEEMLIYKGHKIIKRADGRYYARFTDKNKKRQYVYAITQKACYNKFKALYNKVMMVSKSPSKEKVLTLGFYLKRWLELFRKPPLVAVSTYNKDVNNVNRIYKDPIGSIKITELNTEQLQMFLNKTNGDRQREHFYTILHNSLNKAVSLKYISENPINAVEIVKYEPQEKTPLSRIEERSFIQRAKESPFARYFFCMLYEGLRPGEIAVIDNNNFENGYLSVTNAIGLDGEIKATKTKAGKRKIPIFERMKPYVNNFNKLDIVLDGLREEFNRIRDELGFDSKITLYSLRHTFITRCAEAGIHPKVVQKWAGHKNIKITLEYYTHVSSEWESESTQKIDDAILLINSKFDTIFDTI